jgi:hypothetical protein
MTWVVGNIPEYRALEMFSQALRTPAPITGDQAVANNFQDPVPAIVEDWMHEQSRDPDFIASLGSKENAWPHVPLLKLQSDSQKVTIGRTYARILANSSLIATCVNELDKARRNEAQGLFHAQPYDAPRARYAMDFQGQGKALSGECEALAFIDIASQSESDHVGSRLFRSHCFFAWSPGNLALR